MTESTKDRIKRWAKGLLVVVGAWFGGFSEFPLGQYDAKPQDGRGRPMSMKNTTRKGALRIVNNMDCEECPSDRQGPTW
jgi:hypothetical protein